MQIIKRGKKFYKLNFSNSGKIISKAKVDIDFIQEISFMTESPSNDSTPSQIINYDIVFKLNGKYEEWYENGKIKLIGNYWWDKKNKIWIEYDNKGKLIKKEHWKYGVKL